MAGNEIETALRGIFQRLFKVSPAEVRDDTRRGQLEQWDSLGHLELLEALRQEFQIDIPPEQAVDMETVRDVKRVVTALRA